VCYLHWCLEFFWPFKNAMLCLLAAFKYQVMQIILRHVSLVVCLWSASAYWMLSPKGILTKQNIFTLQGPSCVNYITLTVSSRPDQDLSIPFTLSMILNVLTPSNTATKLTHFFPCSMPWSTWTIFCCHEGGSTLLRNIWQCTIQ